MESKKMSKSEWKAAADAAYEIYTKLQANPGWKEFNSGPCKMWELQVGDSIASKGELVIEGFTIEEIQNFVQDNSTFKARDPMLEEIKEIQRDGDYELSWLKFKGIWPVAARDFITASGVKRVGDKIFLMARSVDYDYPIEKGTVRGHIQIGAYELEKLGDKKVKVTYVSQSDPKGSIPGMIKNKVSKDQAGVPNNLLKALQGKK